MADTHRRPSSTDYQAYSSRHYCQNQQYHRSVMEACSLVWPGSLGSYHSGDFDLVARDNRRVLYMCLFVGSFVVVVPFSFLMGCRPCMFRRTSRRTSRAIRVGCLLSFCAVLKVWCTSRWRGLAICISEIWPRQSFSFDFRCFWMSVEWLIFSTLASCCQTFDLPSDAQKAPRKASRTAGTGSGGHQVFGYQIRKIVCFDQVVDNTAGYWTDAASTSRAISSWGSPRWHRVARSWTIHTWASYDNSFHLDTQGNGSPCRYASHSAEQWFLKGFGRRWFSVLSGIESKCRWGTGECRSWSRSTLEPSAHTYQCFGPHCLRFGRGLDNFDLSCRNYRWPSHNSTK